MADINVSIDPISAIANAVSAIANAVTEGYKFMQTPAGQKLAEVEINLIGQGLKGLADIGNKIASLGAKG